MRFSKKISPRQLLALLLLGITPATWSVADDESGAKTVLGPSNVNLSAGADALRAGDAEKGVRLTHLGLDVAQGRRERAAALSNLCAGYTLLEQMDEALRYCDLAIAENDRNWRAYNNRALVYMALERYEDAEADVVRGQELAPNAKNLKVVKGMLLDETQPVEPNIVIDDRREPDDDEG